MWYKRKTVVPDGRETIYEVFSANDDAGVGVAVADVFVSNPHYHRKTAETYTLVSGALRVHVGMRIQVLHKSGQSLEIPLNTIHWAESLGDTAARISVVTVPAWTPEDHCSLPITENVFLSWENKNQREEIIRVRDAMREHRDQKGDDRCWLDDPLLYWKVLGRPAVAKLLSKPEFLRRCELFHCRRQSPNAADPAVVSVRAGTSSMKDLAKMNAVELWNEYERLVQGVGAHEVLAEQKTEADDQALYARLPEGIPGDTRHPANLVENCGRFYEVKRHQETEFGCVNLHRW